MLLAALEGSASIEIIERDDGFISVNRLGGQQYIAHPRRWLGIERQALRFVRGRVLDIGAGGGRIALLLQQRGRDVVAVDVSPGAIEVCRRRGVRDARVLSIDEIDEAVGFIDTMVMLGNNFGLFASATKARRLLRRFYRLTTDRGRIVAQCSDPYLTDDPLMLAYLRRNVARGRMPGQFRLRVRFRDLATPWFDYLMVSCEEMEQLLLGTGWRIRNVLQSEGSFYVAIVEKE
jgi:SAM-dependent methyltransferase